MSAHSAPATPATTTTQTGYFRKVGLSLFWFAVMILGFILITPNPTAIRVMVFAIIVLSLDYALFGGGVFWRQLVVRGAAFALVLSMLSFLLPEPYVKSIPSRDQVGQKLVDRGILGGAWDGLKVVAFGKSATPNPYATQPSAAHSAPQAPEYVTYLFGANECIEKHLGRAKWSPIDRAIKVCNPAGDCHIEVVGGKDYHKFAFGPATWKFCKEDPLATGVVIWER